MGTWLVVRFIGPSSHCFTETPGSSVHHIRVLRTLSAHCSTMAASVRTHRRSCAMQKPGVVLHILGTPYSRDAILQPCRHPLLERTTSSSLSAWVWYSVRGGRELARPNWAVRYGVSL
nr:hypothetical protein [uncultured bacterium]